MIHGAVLIVDDNTTNMFVLRMMLRKLGHEPIEAQEGRAGLALALERRPKLVLMDLRMPHLDGMATAACIRQELGDAAPAIVAVTATVTPEQRNACAAAGFVALIAKPVQFDELAEIMARFGP